MALGQLTNQIILMFVLMLIGVLINKVGFMHTQTSNDLTNILLYIVSPCLIIGAFEQNYSAARMKQLMLVVIGIFLFYIIEIIIAKFAFGRISNINLQRITKYGSIYSNAGFMGIPLTSALFGNAGCSSRLLRWQVSTSLVGHMGFPSSKRQKKETDHWQNFREIIINPNIIAIFLGLAIFLLSFRMPVPVDRVIHYVSSINTPLSMIVIGNSLGNIRISRQLIDWHLWLAIFFRNLLFPIVAMFILQALTVSGVALDTTVLMAACPTAGLVVLFTLQAYGDTSPAVALMSLSTILSLATIPIVFALMMAL